MDDVTPPTYTPDAYHEPAANSNALSMQPGASVVSPIMVSRRSFKPLLKRVGLGFVTILILIGGITIVLRRSNGFMPVQVGSFDKIQVPLAQFAQTSSSTLTTPTLTVNGYLQVTGGLTVSPSARPGNATAGQIYYDQTSNTLAYYNGTQFINLGSGSANGSLTNILQSTTVLNNTTVSGSSNLTASGGTIGTLAKFTGAQSLGNSILTDHGTSISVAGNVNLVDSTVNTTENTIWSPSNVPQLIDDTDTAGTELGVKFRSDVNGVIKGIRFYKGPTNSGAHTGNLWTASGTLLSSATFTNESASGWQEVRFSTPVSISADTTYVASYFAPNGRYSSTDSYFQTGGTNSPPLHALQNGVDGGNGVFKHTLTSAFPSQTFNSDNYWIDVVFTPSSNNNQYQINGFQISSADLSNNTDLAKRSASQIFTGNNTFKNGVDSTNSFSIQTTAGTSIFSGDTLNGRIYVGPSGGNSTGIILVLGTKTGIGDPTGTEGAIYYNDALKTFRCYRSGFWDDCATLSASRGFDLYDEFMGGQTSFSSPISQLGWIAQAIGANGALSFNPLTPAPDPDHLGVLALQTPALANQGTTLALTTASGPSMFIQTGNHLNTAVAVSGTSQVLRIGLHTETTATTQPLSGVWWEANPAVDPNWRYCYGDGTTATCAPATGNPISANAWTRLEIRVLATGPNTSSSTFTLNGSSYTVSNVTIDTTNRVSPALTCFVTTGAAQSCYWDYFQLRGNTSAAR